ncbi:MAG: SRPBCC family protein [Parvibaculaceae bacterium]
MKRRLKASPEKIWAAWTDPEKIAQWWGPTGMKAFIAEVDPRVGGRFHVAMKGPDGEVHDASGIYKIFDPYRQFTMSWNWITTPDRVSQFTIMLKPDGNETILTLLHEHFFDEAARDGHNRGWSQMLDKFEAVFG